jgi:hypothetical protein
MSHECGTGVRRQPPSLVGLLLPVLTLGCGDPDSVVTLPVAGRVTVNGEPLAAATATVVFHPDRSRGNLSPHEPVGHVESDGSYILATAGKSGAPPGWYLVIVSAYERPKDDTRRHHFAAAKSYHLLVNRRYGDPRTSGLKLEVVPNPAPDQYDLKLAP